MAQSFERWIPQGHRGPKRTLLIVRNPNNTFTCTVPKTVLFLGGTDTGPDLGFSLRKVGVEGNFALRLVSFFNETGLRRESAEHAFPGYEVQSDDPPVQSVSHQMTLGL